MAYRKIALVGFPDDANLIEGASHILGTQKSEIAQHETVRNAAAAVVERKDDQLRADDVLILLSDSVADDQKRRAEKLSKVGATILQVTEPFDGDQDDDGQRLWFQGEPYPVKKSTDDLLDDLFGDDEEEEETPLPDLPEEKPKPRGLPIPAFVEESPEEEPVKEEPLPEIPETSKDPFGLPPFGSDIAPERTPEPEPEPESSAPVYPDAVVIPKRETQNDNSWESEDLEAEMEDPADNAASLNPFADMQTPGFGQPEHTSAPEPEVRTRREYREERQTEPESRWNLQEEHPREATPEPEPIPEPVEEERPSAFIQPPATGAPSFARPADEDSRTNNFEAVQTRQRFAPRSSSSEVVSLRKGRRGSARNNLRLITGSNGGAGKTTITYQLANIHASMLKAVKSDQKVWLLESDYENSKLGERVPGASTRNLGVFLEALADIADNAGAHVSYDRIEEMKNQALEDSSVELVESGVRVLAAPYDTTARSTVNVTTAINSAVKMILSRGDYVYIDAPTLTSIDDRLNATLAQMSGAVILVGNTGDNTSDVIRAFNSITKRGSRGRDGQAMGGIGVDGRNVHIFLNKTNRARYEEAVQAIAQGTGHAVEYSMDFVPEWQDQWAANHQAAAGKSGAWRHLVNTLAHFLTHLDPNDEVIMSSLNRMAENAKRENANRGGWLRRFFRLS